MGAQGFADLADQGLDLLGAGVEEAGAAIYDAGIPKDYYNCPTCGRGVWIIKGAPFRGPCIACMEKEGILGKAVMGLGGVAKGIGHWFS